MEPPPPGPPRSTGPDDVPSSLLLDFYELTMAAAHWAEGGAERPATFSLFVRRLPAERAYLVAAGLDDALAWLEALRFGPAELDALDRLGRFDPGFLAWLGDLRFTGSVRAMPEGTVAFAGEPLVEVDAPLVEGQLAETFLLNQLTLQTTLATKAARVRHAAQGRSLVEFALRRTQGIDAGMKLARACALVGFAGTSNVAAAARYGFEASGTMAHSFIQAYDRELDAFRAFARTMGSATVLLVDTYDTASGVERAVEVALELRQRGEELAAIRIDSGDLLAHARHARARLDEAGLDGVRILASGGLDEYSISDLVAADAPIDGFGVGTSMGVSADVPVLESVYKLVAHDGRPVRKTSPGKSTWPGAKQVWRARDWSHDVLALRDEPAPGPGFEPLLAEVLSRGRRIGAGRRTLAHSAAHFEQGWASMPGPLQRLEGAVAHPVRISESLRRLTGEIDARVRPG